jgi:hypothetical protein
MSLPPEDPKPEPSLALLIVKGVLIIVGAFISASCILVLHTPTGH